MKKKVGTIMIDAGLLWLGDPCYVLPDDSNHNPGADWDAFCKTMMDTRSPTAHNFNGIGVCVSTGYGDGEYPVTAEIKNGRVHSVTVKFI